MNIEKVSLVYFSPTGNTKKTVRNIARGICIDTIEYDLTSFDERDKRHEFDENELVIIGAPVYSGRVPKLVEESFSGLSGNKTPVIVVVTYGNREYDDALLELKNLSKSKGFLPIAAGAFIGEHTFSSKIATSRPDQNDIEKMISFGEQIKHKIQESKLIDKDIEVKGNYPYKKVNRSTAIAPQTKDYCTNCMVCIKKCPTRAISNDDPKQVDTSKCIMCFACVKNCHVNAKAVEVQGFWDKIKSLEIACSSTRKESELII